MPAGHANPESAVLPDDLRHGLRPEVSREPPGLVCREDGTSRRLSEELKENEKEEEEDRDAAVEQEAKARDLLGGKAAQDRDHGSRALEGELAQLTDQICGSGLFSFDICTSVSCSRCALSRGDCD